MKSEHYTPLFCEENIWLLARELIADGVNPEALQVIFISNLQRQVMLFKQRRAGEQGYVVWDYHVVLRRHDEDGDYIYDFDTQLPFPCSSREYISASFSAQSELPEAEQASVRLIPAQEYLHRFSSDRAHMRGVIAEDEFPSWPAITPNHAQVIRLDEYRDMEKRLGDGSRVLSVNAYLETEL
ncbi:MAG: hypothetical protein ABFS08_12365 [Pseudomonadota bacterium]